MAGKGQTDGRTIEERETFLQTRKPQENKSKFKGFVDFLWDPQTKKVLGRTGISWLEITIFYVIFYSCLVLFWACLLYAFLQTLSSEHPRYYGKGTIIGINPGLGFQPWIKKDPDSTLIRFNPEKPKSYARFAKVMTDFMDVYQNTNDTRECGEGDDNSQSDKDPCQFDTTPFEKAGCLSNTDFGYSTGQPCVILSLNRLLGWRPLPYPDDSEPSAVGSRYKAGDIAIDCRGEYFADEEHIGELQYVPESGIAGRFYPYRVANNYHQPIAMVKFVGLPKNVLVMVECKAYSYNILHDSETRMGLSHFEILVEDHLDPTPEED